MKLTRFLFEGLQSDSYYPPYDPKVEDFPFKVDKEELKSTKSAKAALLEKCKEYWESHGICICKDEIIYTDLEKAYETRSVVFKFDDKYYRFEYDHSYDWDDEDVLEEELEEVIPVEETIIVYKRKE